MYPTIKVELTPDNLLDAIGQMSGDEFEQLFRKMVTLRSRKIASTITESEAALLKQIELYQLPPAEHQRLLTLAQKSEQETLSDEAEWAEYGRLAERSEGLNVKRIEAAIKLAAVRNQSLDDTLQQLGLLNKHGA